MVRLTKIYTRSGDGGETMLGDGSMAGKDSARIEAMGAVDEANAAIGLAAAAASGSGHESLLEHLMNDLFDVGADLCAPFSVEEPEGERLRMREEDASRLEGWIDELNEPLGALESFVLPGGTELSARLHVARTHVRRAERRIAALIEAEPGRVNKAALIFINRLSDLLFVLARRANDDGARDVLWKPGGERAKKPSGDEGG
jgi:cob(I)alamin adenosyltransferase